MVALIWEQAENPSRLLPGMELALKPVLYPPSYSGMCLESGNQITENGFELKTYRAR